MAGAITRNPREAVGILAAFAAFSIICVNALFLQSGPHPAPIFAYRGPPAFVPPMPTPAPAMPPQKFEPVARTLPSTITPPKHAGAEASRNDPIAQLLAPSKRVLAVQRVLTEYGYGQIKPTGEFGPETQDAIKKFERSRKMPVTGSISDQLVRALSEMSGRALD